MNRERTLDSDNKTADSLTDHVTHDTQQLGVLLEDLRNVQILHSTKQQQLAKFKDTCITEEQDVKVTVTNC